MLGSDLLAGVLAGVGRYADSLADFANTSALLKSVSVIGWKVAAGDSTVFFSDSTFSAGNVGSITIRNGDFSTTPVLYVPAGATIKSITSTSTLDSADNWKYPATSPSDLVEWLTT